ncbi:MAG: uncharacterized protein QOK46_477 [Microbacteriaceae bacterium]|nr:uncharacterized protein [Microbacteriaceae bacterium]
MSELFSWPSDDPRLIGSRCTTCEVVTFPAQSSCPHCTSADVTEIELDRQGTLWTWTTQGFRPKSPPYAGDDTPETFETYGVGYIELAGQVRVESRLTVNDPERLHIGMPMELVIVPFGTGVTYAFAPIEDVEAVT